MQCIKLVLLRRTAILNPGQFSAKTSRGQGRCGRRRGRGGQILQKGGALEEGLWHGRPAHAGIVRVAARAWLALVGIRAERQIIPGGIWEIIIRIRTRKRDEISCA